MLFRTVEVPCAIGLCKSSGAPFGGRRFLCPPFRSIFPWALGLDLPSCAREDSVDVTCPAAVNPPRVVAVAQCTESGCASHRAGLAGGLCASVDDGTGLGSTGDIGGVHLAGVLRGSPAGCAAAARGTGSIRTAHVCASAQSKAHHRLGDGGGIGSVAGFAITRA